MSDASVTQESIDRLNKAWTQLREQMSQVIVGQDEVIDHLLISLFSRGHCLLEGVPGLAKTLMISTLARCLSMSFARIQFTPDLMPADITGTDVLQENRDTGEREFRFIQGPLFHNVVLADEINRTPPKTQAATAAAVPPMRPSGRSRRSLPMKSSASSAPTTCAMKDLRETPSMRGRPRERSSGSRRRISRLCARRFPKPIPGSRTILRGSTPAFKQAATRCLRKSATSATGSS